MSSDEKDIPFEPNPGMVRVSGNKKLKINEYDNAVTALYKLSDSIDNPKEYIYLEGNNYKNFSYTTVDRIILNRIGEGKKLKDFYQEISDKFPELSWKDLATIYYEVVIVKLKKLCKVTDDEELSEKCTKLGDDKNLIKSINGMFELVKDSGKAEDEELSEITNINAFAAEYKKWSKQRDIKMKNQTEKSKWATSVQDELDSIRGVRYYKPNIVTVTYKLKPLLESKEGNYKPSSEEGIEIFRNAIVSEDVPYIQYNSEDGRNLFWIFNDSTVVPPSNFLDPISRSTRINTIYILLSLGDPKQKNNLVKCIYYIDIGEFTLEAPNKGGGLKRLRKNIETAFPMLVLGKEEQVRVKGYFEVDDVTINDISYHYMLNTDELHKLYLYIEESSRSFADKHRSNIHYRSLIKKEENSGNSASVTISFGNFVAENDDENFIPESMGPVTNQNGEVSGKLRVNVVKADSIEVLEQFQIVFSRLLARYKVSKPDIEEYISFIIPEYSMGTPKVRDSDDDEDEDNVKKKKKKSTTGGADSKNKNLRRAAPDVFVAKYARACQCGKQPLVAKPDEVEDWRKYSKDGKKRQVMPYPPLKADSKGFIEDPLTMNPNDERVKLWIVCPLNKLPYPALKRSKLTNRDEYPYIPCCGHQDSLTDSKSNYYKYHSGSYVVTSTKKNKYPMSTMKILGPGRKGGIGIMLPRLLSSYLSFNDEEKIFKRYGVPIDNNSLIHCVLVAIRETNYSKLHSEGEKTKYAIGVREYIAKTMNPALFKQELYDMSREEIVSQLESKDVYFASEKFYRGLEELFDINIFVFDTGSTPEHPAETEEKLTIEIPRSKICHIRPNRASKRSVLIFKHWGTEIDKINNPHCELIISSSKSNDNSDDDNKKKKRKGHIEENITYIFDENMSKILYQTLHRSMKVYVWSYPEERREKVTSEDLITRINPFSQIDWKSLFNKYNIVSQRVDSYGKLRVIGIQIKKDIILPLFIPPSQPFNLPPLIKIEPVDEDIVLSILGPPSGIAKEGLWFSIIDYNYGIYVPTVSGKNINYPEIKEKDVGDFKRFKLNWNGKKKREITPNLPNSPVLVNVEQEYPIEKMRIAKRNMYFMVQIVSWLWLVDELSYNNDEGQSLEEWWQKWVIEDEKVDTTTENIEGLGIKLPDITNTKDGIKIMTTIWPNFFRKDKNGKYKIRLYPKLEEKLKLFFKRRERTSDIDRKNRNKKSKFLRGIYIWESDFVPTQMEDNKKLIFLSAQRLQIWIENQAKKNTNTGTQINITKKADPSRVVGNKPYIYMDSTTSKAYIIQNVQGGDLERVLNLCNEWRNAGKNIGFSAPPINIEGIPYVLYSISPEGKFVQIKDNSNKDRNYYHVIKYTKEGRYAAMLPLL